MLDARPMRMRASMAPVPVPDRGMRVGWDRARVRRIGIEGAERVVRMNMGEVMGVGGIGDFSNGDGLCGFVDGGG